MKKRLSYKQMADREYQRRKARLQREAIRAEEKRNGNRPPPDVQEGIEKLKEEYRKAVKRDR